MSIGKRLIDLARAELNSLLERAARTEDEEEADRAARADGDGWDGRFGAMSDSELEAELERRRQAREEVENVTRPRGGSRPTTAGRPTAGSGGRRPADEPFHGYTGSTPRRTAAGDEAIRKAYAALEIQPGSDFDTVRKSYRRLMRKYHPDLHAGSAEKQRDANALAQRLTESYKLLEKQLRK